MSAVTAIYAGTFDPLTLGHLDIIRRAAPRFDRVQVLVAIKEGTLFSSEERLAIAQKEVEPYENVEAELFEGLLVSAAVERGAGVLLRGIRGSHDWDHEMQMAFANQQLSNGALETVFLTPSPGTSMISGTLVREVASLGGDPSPWVSPAVAQALRDRFPHD